MNGLNNELLKLTKDFIEKFKETYRLEDKTATDSYMVNMMLPDYLSAAIPVDMNRVFYAPLISQGLVSEFVKAEYKKNIQGLAHVLENVLGSKKSFTVNNYRIEYVKNKYLLSCSSNNFKAEVSVLWKKIDEIDYVVVSFGKHDKHQIDFRKNYDAENGGFITTLKAELPWGMNENIRNTNSFWLAMQVIDQGINEPDNE